MPNRIIKESICTSCEVERLTWQHEVFWFRLLVNCDDYGRMDARPEILRARLFPLRLDRVSAKDINGFLKALQEVGLIQVYIVEGKSYLQVVTWEKHQQQRAKRSKYPSSDSNGNQVISDVPVIQTESETDSESEREKNKEKKFEVKPGVFLTHTECEKLIDQFGEAGANERIENLSLGILSKGYRYKSHYHAILSWERNPKGNGHKPEQKGAHDPDKYIKGRLGHMVVR